MKEAGDSALLLELEARIDPTVNARAIAIAGAVRKAAVEGVRDVVSTYRSIGGFFHPLKTRVEELRTALDEASAAPVVAVESRCFDVPVAYGGANGPDLADVARYAGLSEAEVIRRHASAEYRVFMLGFVPGFPYMGVVDAAIAAPRRRTPRLEVPAGSVGIAGSQTGIYPRNTPGGWQIIGRTDVQPFDESRDPPALFTPGDLVRFVPVRAVGAPQTGRGGETPAVGFGTRVVTVLQPGLLTTVQDLGRWGHQNAGVSVAGAMDTTSHRVANLCVGNAEDAATLEVTIGGPELRLECDATLALSGADLEATVDGAPVRLNTALRMSAGAVLRFGGRRSGARAYVALDGGVDVPQVLGSRSTHLPSGMGGAPGRPLRAGDRLPLGERRDAGRIVGRNLAPRPVAGARLRVRPGPQADFFESSAFDALEHGRFIVSPHSNRMAYRLAGPTLIRRASDREMISDVTVMGGIQIPPSGEPILLMADRQTTGGYPQIATVISADLPRAAQLAPGEWVEFEVCTAGEAVAALIAQEALLLAVR